jgi:hypothetical protein
LGSDSFLAAASSFALVEFSVDSWLEKGAVVQDAWGAFRFNRGDLF